MRRFLWMVLAAALVAGCAFNDCRFDPVGEVEGRGTLTADASAVGDTLTVALVSNLQAYDVPRLEARGPYTFTPGGSADTRLELAYQIEGVDPDEDARTAPPLASTLRGDTLFVYVEGSLSPDLFTEACSPPDFYLGVFIDALRAPESVRAARLTALYVDELAPATAAALRQRDAERPRAFLAV